MGAGMKLVVGAVLTPILAFPHQRVKGFCCPLLAAVDGVGFYELNVYFGA